MTEKYAYCSTVPRTFVDDCRKTLGGGDNFWLVNTCKAGGWFACNCLSTWALLAEPLAQHILIIILILTHF